MGFFCHDGQIIDVCKRGNVFFVTNGFVKEISALKTKLCLALCLKQPVGCGYVRIVKLYPSQTYVGSTKPNIIHPTFVVAFQLRRGGQVPYLVLDVLSGIVRFMHGKALVIVAKQHCYYSCVPQNVFAYALRGAGYSAGALHPHARHIERMETVHILGTVYR